MRLLTWALLFGAEREDVGYLLDHGATVSNGGVQDNHFEEPTLFYALENASLAELLIERGANVEAANNFGKTALMYAAQYDQAAVIKLLLAHGAKVSAKTQLPPMEDPSPENSDLNIKCDQRTALLYAAENASAQTINLLIDGGAKSNETDTCGHQVIEYLTQNLLLSAEEQKGIVARLSIH